MDSNELRDNLTTFSDREVVAAAQKYICLSLANLNNPDHHSHMLLDMVYDKVYERVCRHPHKCQVTIAA